MKGYSSLYSDYSDGKTPCSPSPLKGHSQKYQEEYSVYSKMVTKDIKRGVYDPKEGGYIKNPTTVMLESLYDGSYIGSPTYNIDCPYVIDQEGKVLIGKRNGFGRNANALPTPHPTLIGGLDPKVKMAGMLTIRNGKILSYDDRSGHYRPHKKSIKWADIAFENFPKHKKFKGGK